MLWPLCHLGMFDIQVQALPGHYSDVLLFEQNWHVSSW